MMEMLEKMGDKLTEFVDAVEGIELNGHGKMTLISISNSITLIDDLDTRWKDGSPLFKPFLAFDVNSQSLWAASWSGIYLELLMRHQMPVEALHCMQLAVEWTKFHGGDPQPVDIPLTFGQGSLTGTTTGLFNEENRFFIRCGGLSDPVIAGRLRESYHVFAIHGWHQGWWTLEEVESLPEREQSVVDYLTSMDERKRAEAILNQMEEE